jgi:hypothetical protein
MLDEWRATLARHTPPTELLTEAGKWAIGPAAGAALVVFAVTLLLLGRRAALFGGALALLAGVAFANYFRNVFPWWPVRLHDGRYIGWHWLPLLLLFAQFDGLFARVPTVPSWGGWRLRLGIGLVAALLLVPHDLHRTWPLVLDQWPYPFRARVWPLLAFVLAVTLGWAGSEAAARQSPGGMVGLGLAFALFGASFVLAHAHSGLLADALSIPGAALFAISLVALFCKVDIGGALPGIALLLPSVLLVAATETYSEVPWYAFALAGLPPLTVGLLAIPPLARTTGFWRGVLFWILCLGPTVASVLVAASKETLIGDEVG